jgi:hypothetical protein
VSNRVHVHALVDVSIDAAEHAYSFARGSLAALHIVPFAKVRRADAASQVCACPLIKLTQLLITLYIASVVLSWVSFGTLLLLAVCTGFLGTPLYLHNMKAIHLYAKKLGAPLAEGRKV